MNLQRQPRVLRIGSPIRKPLEFGGRATVGTDWVPTSLSCLGIATGADWAPTSYPPSASSEFGIQQDTNSDQHRKRPQPHKIEQTKQTNTNTTTTTIIEHTHIRLTKRNTHRQKQSHNHTHANKIVHNTHNNTQTVATTR